MRKNYYSFITCVGLLIAGCGGNQQQIVTYNGGELPLMKRIEGKVTTIDVENAKLIDYDDLIEDIHYLQLDNKHGLISEVTQLIYFSNKYYISDKDMDQVLIFDNTGKCIKKVSHKGRGPKEYLGVTNIDINRQDSLLLINDHLALQTLFFDLDGNFKYKRTTTVQKDKVYSLQDSTLLYQVESHQNEGINELQGYGLLISSGDSLIRKGFRFLPVQDGYRTTNSISKSGENIYYRPLYSDSIYCINSDSTYSLAYHAKFKKSLWEKHNKDNEFQNLISKSTDHLKPWYQDTEDFFQGFTNIEGSSYMGWIIHDKKQDITYLSKMKQYDDIQQLDRFWGFDCHGIKDDYFIQAAYLSTFETGDVWTKVKKGELKVTDPNLETIIKNMDANSNPVLIFTKYKSIVNNEE